MARRLRPLAPLLALAACAATSGAPGWFETAQRREAAPLPAALVESADGALRARVPARLRGGVVADASGYRLVLDADAGTPLECSVFTKQALDPAGSLAGLSRESFEALAKQAGQVSLRRVAAVDAGAIGESPYLRVRWLYRTETPKGARVGELTHALAVRGSRSVYCRHNEVGFEATFDRVFAAFVAGLEPAKGERDPVYAQISTLSLDGTRVGFEHTRLRRDGDGPALVETRSSLLVPVGNDRLEATDRASLERAQPDGSLLEQRFAEARDGALVSQLALVSVGGGAWRVSGTFAGRALDARIGKGGPPASWLGATSAARKVIANSPVGAAVRLRRWLPDSDPTRFSEQTLEIERALGGGRFAATLAATGRESRVVVDRDGLVASGRRPRGSAALDVERIYTRGTP